ncbi:helix-turn-helix transcriptional regulator [Streptococcus ratti]|uniref:HTH cro/C1-type domain-containing protein n=1 Tax=Streptococcus ratti FA-1 = DSM 20564 TaxID=699248 RepID=A0ABN0GRX4_STRRT|nr:helix-turn-helix transcriptional regulator [Streptococcus ratti]EJN93169.1 hypothetical protein SRA_09778 [Streptococcus ratti FA-1 = DSM 20564]EMP70101.1 hypothetical protein D822_05507 [Streptococcus ratti FA-1 = DSM 20564]QEY06857.1 helix-turn-helix transcriptional regulator [Streptococcus ratti]VEI59274.1 transcriptional regulator [Streptococcus mutans]
MTIKEDLGQRIKDKRNQQQLTQSLLCGDETKLTIRQLQRIEGGQSLPTLEKLEFIADRLGTKIADLLEGSDIQLPDDYWKLKGQIIKFPTYGDKERLRQKQELIEEIYDKYFDILPEDELLFLDLSENILESSHEKDIPNIEEIYDDAFEQVLKKETFTLNDYLYMSYFLQKCGKTADYDRVTFKLLEQKLLKQELAADELYNIKFLIAVMEATGVYALHDDYQDLLPLLEKAQRIIDKAQLLTYKPALLELEAKYYIKVVKDKKRAKELYQQALVMGEILGDSIIIADVKMEMANDGID